MFPKKGIERGSDEESIHMAVAQRDCSGDLFSLLVPWPLGWRFLRSLTTTVSVIRVLASGGSEFFDASRTLSLIAANLGSKDIQSEVTVVAEKNSKRWWCPVLAAVAHFLEAGAERGGDWSEGEVLVVKAQLHGVGGHLVGGQRGAQPGGYRTEQ